MHFKEILVHLSSIMKSVLAFSCSSFVRFNGSATLKSRLKKLSAPFFMDGCFVKCVELMM